MQQEKPVIILSKYSANYEFYLAKSDICAYIINAIALILCEGISFFSNFLQKQSPGGLPKIHGKIPVSQSVFK